MPREDQNLHHLVTDYNLNVGNNGHGILVIKQIDSKSVVSGPLRVYWGIGNPIRLKQFDEDPAQIETNASWRHSYFPSVQSNSSLAWTPKLKPAPALSNIDEHSQSVTNLPTRRGSDDSSIPSSSLSDTSGVVMRPIRKSNTVAYRGDPGRQWKRASINGHVYNNDTRIFIPVLGSCTNVTATSKMTTSDVIKTLLDKFKIENKPDEFSLYLVPDKGGEHLLKTSAVPLLERLKMGPDETQGKLFIKEKIIPEKPKLAWNTLTKTNERPASSSDEETTTETPVEKYVEHLPEEVEQLIALPEALLQGLLNKFIKDEAVHIKKVKKKYKRIRNMMTALLSRQESFV